MTEWFRFGLFVVTAGLMLPIVQYVHRKLKLVAANYSGDFIVCGMGAYLWLLLFVYPFIAAAEFVPREELHALHAGITFMLIWMSCTMIVIVGGLDDLLGDKRVKGLRGHWNALWHRRMITTGILKAGTISAMAMIIVLETAAGWAEGMVQAALIALMTNTINLLDVRPGRAIKGYFSFAIVLLGCGFGYVERCLPLLAPMLVGSAILFVPDVRGKLMLGDSGANLLGFTLGCCFVIGSPAWLQLLMLAVLVLMHVAAERGSLSDWIARSRLLSWLDRLGRLKQPG